MLQHAIEAIRQEKFAQAKELLTKLLQTDQNNPLYWVWLSAAMETQKERLYCLQAALKLDPTNAAARRGLLLMGALPPDESITPFPMNHPRPWENKVKLVEEQPKEPVMKRLTGSPVLKLAVIFSVAGLILGGTFFGLRFLNVNRPAAPQVVIVGTPRPTVTPYKNANAPDAPTVRPGLALQLAETYTPTPVYAATPHTGASMDSYRGAIRAYNQGQWDNAVLLMEQVATAEPGSADALFFAGEARRMAKRYNEALGYYAGAMRANPNFAPSYLGRARTNLALNPNANIFSDLNLAIDLDPNYAEAYLERAGYFLRAGDYAAARADTEQADVISPGSPLVKVLLARILLAQKENPAALEAAQQANQLDLTLLEGYLVLGMAYHANGQTDQAVQVLETYVQYQPDNADAFTVLGAAYIDRQDYDSAQKYLDQALRLDKTHSEAYFWQGESLLAQGKNESALESFQKSVDLNANSFRNTEGLARAYLALEEWGKAYLTISPVEKMAADNRERGQYLYISALANQNLNAPSAAIKAWKELLSLPEQDIPAERRAEAQRQLDQFASPTPTPTVTPLISSTPTKTPRPADTRQPTMTLKPTNTKQPTATATP
jgi:tetratricopeptide (TPR) repeat protein